MLKATVDAALAMKAVKPRDLERVIVDPTVEEKAIAHPVGDPSVVGIVGLLQSWIGVVVVPGQTAALGRFPGFVRTQDMVQQVLLQVRWSI